MKTGINYYKIVLGLLLVMVQQNQYAQAPLMQWQKSYGGTGYDNASSIKQTTDGGYIVVGSTDSNDGDVTGNHGAADYWVVKTDWNGNIIWQKTYGGINTEVANGIQQTTDGGFIIAGSTRDSVNGDVGPSHGDEDYWIVKTDSLGTIQWQKCYGGTAFDRANAVKQTIDKGYIIAGQSASHNGDVIGNHPYSGLIPRTDFWVIKLDTSGTIQWQKCLGGNGDEAAFDLEQTFDKGYIVAGYTSSINNGDVTGGHGYDDYWVVKLDSAGTLQWQKSLGGTLGDRAHSVQQTSDGGYIVAGFSNSSNGDLTGYHGNNDYWIVKMSSAGGIQWKNCYGGGGDDKAKTLKQTTDGGYIVVGESNSNNGDVSGNHGNYDYWVLKLDSAGGKQWQKCYGGSGTENHLTADQGHCIVPTTDGGYIVCGSSTSTDGDVTGNHGNFDFWVVKLAGSTTVNEIAKENYIVIYPNPSATNVNIALQAMSKAAEIKIIDVLGKTMKFQKTMTENTTLDVSDLQNGIYFLSVKTSEGILTKKIIVQR